MAPVKISHIVSFSSQVCACRLLWGAWSNPCVIPSHQGMELSSTVLFLPPTGPPVPSGEPPVPRWPSALAQLPPGAQPAA